MALCKSFFFLTKLKAAEERCFHRFRNSKTVADSHFHPLDLSNVSSIRHKVLHGASHEAILSLWQVEPQSICLCLVVANNDDIGPGCGGGITFLSRGQSEVIWDDYGKEMNCIF